MSEDDSRGWRLDNEIPVPAGVVAEIAWSPDGQWLAAADPDGSIGLWDVERGALGDSLEAGDDFVRSLAWSPDGSTLAAGTHRGDIALWEVAQGARTRTLAAHAHWVRSLAWSADGSRLATASNDRTIALWKVGDGALLHRLEGHEDRVLSVALAPDGRTLVSAGGDGSLKVWDAEAGTLLRSLEPAASWERSVVFSPDGFLLASASDQHAIRVWSSADWSLAALLEGHRQSIACVAFSADGQLLASRATDGAVHLWHTNTWAAAPLFKHHPTLPLHNLAFHPSAPRLAVVAREAIRIVALDADRIFAQRKAPPPDHTVTAKVVIVGDPGCGKSSLAEALADSPFESPGPGHGRTIYTLDRRRVRAPSGAEETRETLLWDLAAQPDALALHALALEGTAVALVAFDPQRADDPLPGVRRWCRILARACDPPPAVILVATRRGGGASAPTRSRIAALLVETGMEAYVETDAAARQEIPALRAALGRAIAWEKLPRAESTALLQQVATFLSAERKAGRLLSTAEDLYLSFRSAGHATAAASDEELRRRFETCLEGSEARGQIHRFPFGDLVLLAPSRLGPYAASLLAAAREAPSGLATVGEDDILAGRFPLPMDKRLPVKAQETLLLSALVTALLGHGIACREVAPSGPLLIFPDQRRAAEKTSEKEGDRRQEERNEGLAPPEVLFELARVGASPEVVFATLLVRLAHGGIFEPLSAGPDQACFAARIGGTCALRLEEGTPWEDHNRLFLAFTPETGEEARFLFEDQVTEHLQRRIGLANVGRRRLFRCAACQTRITAQTVRRRRARGSDWLRCPVCDERVSLRDREERLTAARDQSAPPPTPRS